KEQIKSIAAIESILSFFEFSKILTLFQHKLTTKKIPRMAYPGMDAGFDVVSLFANSQRIKNAKDGIFLRITIPPTLRRRRNLRRRL
nr:hypothetical protein [Spirochaetaceae bacterium]